MGPTFRALALAVPIVIGVGLARPRTETTLEKLGVHPAKLWAEKARTRGTVEIALAGDSRVYIGLSPGEMRQALPARRVQNLGFSGVCLCGPYLEFLEQALDPSARDRVVVLGVTPHSLTGHAARDNGYLAELRRPRTEVFERRFLLPVLDFVEPFPVDDLGRRWLGAGETRPAQRVVQRFHADGWVASTSEPPRPELALREYRTVLATWKYDAARLEELAAFATRLRGEGVRVVAFRPPSSVAMRRLEDDLGQYDEPQVRARLLRAGAEYLGFADDAFSSYDGSHLEEGSARSLSQQIAARLAVQN